LARVSIYAGNPGFETPWWKATYAGYDDPQHGRIRSVFLGPLIGTSWESTADAEKKMVPASQYQFGTVIGHITDSTIEVKS
jgi:hypothetical protein